MEPSRVATCGGEVELEVDGLAGPISEVLANGGSVLQPGLEYPIYPVYPVVPFQERAKATRRAPQTFATRN